MKSNWRGFVSLCIALGGAITAVATPLSGATLAREQIQVLSLALRAEPAQQTVPKDIATIVGTHIQAPQIPSGLAPFSQDAVIRATLRGPSLKEPLELTIRPNSPFHIPPLSVPGLHTLEDIRLISNGDVLMRANPETATIEVIDKLLVTQVTARPLSAEEIREKGIVFDKSNFQAFNFATAFAIEDKKITIEFPVVVPKVVNEIDESEPTRVQVPSISPPTMPSLATLIPDTLKIQTQVPNLTVVGFMMDAPQLKDKSFTIPPIPGVIVIPGDIGFLNQFFSVILMVGNVAPNGSNLVVSEVKADIVLPPGNDNVVGSGDDPLRMARTAAGESQKRQIIVQPGPDGRLGTGDDIATIGPGESGQAEYLVEGRREGSHNVEMEIKATLDGLPVGPVEVRGRAIGSVLVRNPNFTLTFTHPEVVSSGEKYTLDVTVTNTSSSPANFVSVNLYPRYVSGARILNEGTQSIESLPPGDSKTVTFSMLSLRTGRVTAATLDSGENVAGRFQLKTAIGELNVPLSPDSLVLPKEAQSLPLGVREAAVALLGKAWSVATAPAAALPKDVRRFSKKIVMDRAVEVAEAGFRVRLKEPVPDSAAQLYMDFLGSNYPRLPVWFPAPADLKVEKESFEGFDELRRRSVRGDAFAQAVGAELAGTIASQGVAAAHEDLAEKWSYRPGHISIVAGTAGGPLPVAVRLLDKDGRRVGGVDANGKTVSEIPFGDWLATRDANGRSLTETVVLAVPTPGDYRLELHRQGDIPDDAPYTLSIVVPTAAGELRQIVYSLTARDPPVLTFTSGDPYRLTAALMVNDQPSTANQKTAIQDHTVQDPPARLLGVVQQAEADIIACEWIPPIPVGRVAAALFSEEVDAATAGDVSHYTGDENQVLDVKLQPGRRIVYLAMRDPLGPYVPRTLTTAGILDNRGQAMTPETVPIESTIADAGGVLSGRVLNADGTPVPYADVRLYYWLDCELMPAHWVGVSAKTADIDGRYSWDFVTRMTHARVVATDPQTEERQEVRFTVQRNGQRINADIVFLGRGTFQGTTRAEDGTILADTFVKVTSLTDDSQYAARTDANGRFSVFRVPVGSFVVEMVHVARRARLTITELMPGAGRVVTRDLTLVDPESTGGPVIVKRGTVKGHVYRTDGVTPARDVPVILSYRSGSQAGVGCAAERDGYCAVAFARTTGDGGFSFANVVAGELRVYAFDQAALQEGRALAVLADKATASVNVVLTGGLGRVRGVVRDPAGNFVAGVQVGGGLSPIVTTDAAGSFLLEDVPLGRREIVAVSQSLKTRGGATVDLSRAGEEVFVTIVLEAVGSVAGQVLDSAGLPLPRQKVFLFTWREEVEFETVMVIVEIKGEATTGADGRYRIDGVPMGGYFVSAFRPDFKDGNITEAVLKFQGQVFRANIKFRGANGRVYGKVFDDDGRTPLKAHVSVSGDQLLVIGAVGVLFKKVQNFKVVDTDFTSGEYSIPGLWVGPITVRAAGQFSPDPIVAQTAIPSPGADVELNFRLQPTSQIRGVVYQPDGATPVGRDVIVRYRSNAFQMDCRQGDFGEEICVPVPAGVQDETVLTQKDGSFWLPVVNAGGFMITAEDPATGKVGDAGGSVRAGETAHIRVRLKGIGELTVKVLSSDGFTPIPGAKIEVAQVDYPSKRVTLNADSEGTAIFVGADGFSEGDLTVKAIDVRNGFAGRASGRIVRDGEKVLVRVFLYDAAGTVYGTVFRPDRVTRVPNAQYVLSNSAGPLAFGVTDAEGNYRQELIPLGPFSIDVFEAATGRRGFGSGRVDFKGQEVPVFIFEDALGLVRGTALQGGLLTPLKGWDTTLSQRSPSGRVLPNLVALTGVDGGFSFPGVSQGTFTVGVEKREGAQILGRASATGRIEREGQAFDIPLIVSNIAKPVFGRVQGTVFNPDGSPAANAQVEICTPEWCPRIGPSPRVVTAGVDGEFSLENVPLGRVTIDAQAQASRYAGSASGLLEFDGDIATVDVVLVGLTEIRGVVVNAESSPVVGVEVRLSGLPSSGCTGDCVLFSNLQGEFVFHDVPARTFLLRAFDPISQLKGVAGGALNPGESKDVRLVLEPTAEIRGRVLLASGQPASAIVVQLALGGANPRELFLETQADGRFLFDTVPLLSYRLDLFDPLGEGVAFRSGQLVNNVDYGDITLDEAPPAVASVAPGSGALAVPLGQKLRIVFSEPVSPASITPQNVALSSAAGLVSASLALTDGNTSVTLTPIAALHDQAAYTLRVKGVLDLAGKAMVGETTSTFTTVDVRPPSTLNVSPAPGTRGVSLETTIRIQFSEPVDAARFSPPLQLLGPAGPVDGRRDVILGNTTLVFTPARPLDEDTTYTVRLGPACDFVPNCQPIGTEYTFVTTDRTPPAVLSLTPSSSTVIEGATTTVTADVGATHDVAFVDFSIDDVFAFVDRTPPYQMTAQATSAFGQPGDRVKIAAVATDVSGNRGVTPAITHVTVVADQPPAVTLLPPASGLVAGNGDRITVGVRAVDDLGVARIAYKAATGHAGDTQTRVIDPPSRDRTETFGFNIPAEAPPGSTIAIEAWGVDTKGQLVAVPPISVTVRDAVAPTVTITGVSSGQKLVACRETTVVVTAEDAGGVARVQFAASGLVTKSETRVVDPLQSAVAVAFSFTVPCEVAPGASVTLTASAADSIGNTQDAAPVLLVAGDSRPPTVRLRRATDSSVIVPGSTFDVIVEAEDEIAVSRAELNGVGAFPVIDAKPVSPPRGSASLTFSILVPSDAAEGATLRLETKAFDTSGNASRPAVLMLTIASTVDVVLPSSVILLAGESKPVTVQLGAPAPGGGRQVELVSEDPNIALVTPPILVFAEGETSKEAVLTGVSGGTTFIFARVNGVQRTSLTAVVRGGIVTGTVYDTQFQPVAGVQLTIEGGPLAVTTTDGQGRYFVEGVPGPTVSVKAFDPPSKRRGFSQAQMNRPNGFVRINVILTSAGAIRGRVFRPDTTTAVGAGVKVDLFGSGEALRTTFTRSDGGFEFPLVVAGSYVLEAHAFDGSRGRSGAVAIGETGEEVVRDIVFLGRGRVQGTVRDGGGAALANAPFTFRSDSLFGGVTIVNTAADGTYRFDGIFVGTFNVQASDPRSGLGAGASGQILREGDVVTADIALPKYGFLEGRVHRHDGTPVAGAFVSVHGRSVSADATGRYSFAYLPLGGFTVSASDAATRGMGSASGGLETHNQTVTLDITFAPQGSVAVIVKDPDDHPVPGAKVTLNVSNGVFSDQIRATTGPDGIAALDHVLVGRFNVSALAGSFAGSASGTVTVDTLTEVTIRFTATPPAPTASIAGTVFVPDGQTPASIGHVIIGEARVDLAPDGTFRLDGLGLGQYAVRAFDGQGRFRARLAEPVVLHENGQIATRTLTFVGLGTVKGQVVASGGADVGSMAVEVRSHASFFGRTRGTTTGASGEYELFDVPVGAVTVVVADPVRQLLGEGTGAVRADGETATVNILLTSNVVTLPMRRFDANNVGFNLAKDGAVDGHAVLDVIVGGATQRFAGEGHPTGEESDREVVVRQAIGALAVTRKTYVPRDGYFARHLEVVHNPTTASVTVDLRVTHGVGAGTPDLTSSGDAVLNVADAATADRWWVAGGQAAVFDGPSAGVRVGAATFAGGSATYEWRGVELGAGETVAFLHFSVRQLSTTGGLASAERLVQLPPEALVGLAADELVAIRNFAAPAGGISTLRPLPTLTSTITGQVLEGDLTTPIPGTTVSIRSEHPLFGRTYTAGTDGSGRFVLTGRLTDDGTSVVVPAESTFTLDALHPVTAVAAPTATGAFLPEQTIAAQDVRFTNTGAIQGTVRRHNGTPATSGSVRVSRPAPPFDRTVGISGEARFRLTGVPAGTFDLLASSGGLTGAGTATVVVGATSEVPLTLEATGAVRGRVRRGPTAASAVDVHLTRSGFGARVSTDTAGLFAFTDIPLGTFTLRALDPITGLSDTRTVLVEADQTTVQDLNLVGLGSVSLQVSFARGVPARSTVEIQEDARGVSFRAAGTTDANGRLTITNVTTGGFRIRALHPASGRFVSETNGDIASDGQLVHATITLPPVVSVAGRVTRADGAPASSVEVTITSPVPQVGGAFNVRTGADGTYQYAALPLGAISALVSDIPNGLFGEAFAEGTEDGQVVVLDITLSQDPTTLPRTRYDANNAAFVVGPSGAAGGLARLDVLTESTTSFAGRNVGRLEEGGQEIVTFAQTIAGLAVSRKVYVPRDGYFARYLEIFRNTSGSAVTFTGRSVSAIGNAAVVSTASGDDVVNALDLWVAADDRAFVSGPVAAAAIESEALSYEWQTTALASGESAIFMHFVVQQLSPAAAQASAERLVQLPPEALVGLSDDERSQIRNFTIPSGQGAVPPLPALTGVVTGRVLAVDAITPIPTALVRFRSGHILFGRMHTATAGADGRFRFEGALNDAGTSRAVPLHAFTLEATHPVTTAMHAVSGEFQGATAQKDVVFTGTGMIAGHVRRHTGTALPGAEVSIVRAAPPFGTTALADDAGRYAFTGLTAGTYELLTSLTHPQGSPLVGRSTAVVTPGAVTATDVVIVGTGHVTGTVRSGAGVGVSDLSVQLTNASSSYSYAAPTDGGGGFRFLDVPAATYTLRAVEPKTGVPATASVTVAVNATTLQDLTLIGLGEVRVHVSFTNGQPAVHANVRLTDSLARSTVKQTATNGFVSFTDVPAGPFTVRVTHPQLPSVTRDASGEVPAAGGLVPIDVILPVVVAAPNVAGLLRAEAEAAITAAGLTVGSVTPESSDDVPENAVIRQDPGPGTLLVEGSSVALVVSSGAPQVCRSLANNAVSLWTGDGSSDDVVGGRHGNLRNGASFTDGKVASAFAFDGVDDYVQVPPRNWGFATEATVIAWIKTVDSHPGAIVSLGHGNLQDEMLLYAGADGRVGIYNHKSPGVYNGRQSSTAINDGQWHLVAGVLAGSGQCAGLRIFVDGIEEPGTCAGSVPDIIDTTPRALVIGQRSNPSGGVEAFHGAIDEVTLFGRSLRPSEIQDIFLSGPVGQCRAPGCVLAPSGIVSWWPMRGSPRDIVAGGNGTLVNGAAYTQGRVGKGLVLDGIDDYVSTDRVVSYQNGATFEAWIRTTKDRGMIVSDGGGAGGHSGMGLFIEPGGVVQLWSMASALNFIVPGPVVSDGAFHHVVGTWDGTTSVDGARLYVDGILVASRTARTTIGQGSVPVFIGGASLGYHPFEGVIDEVTLYGRALSASEVRALYQVGGAGKCAAAEVAEVTGVTEDLVVNGDVPIGGTTSDDPSVLSRIDILVDGQVHLPLMPPTFAGALDTTPLDEGPHVLTARAVDRFGQNAPEGPPVHIIVNNRALTVTITTPAAGTAVRDTVTMRAVASELVQRVQFEAGAQTAADEQEPYEATFDLAGVAEGALPIRAVAIGYGETAEASRSIALDRTAPAPPDVSRITAEAGDDGVALVVGAVGAVEGGARVVVTHVGTDTQATAVAAGDGSFSFAMAAAPGDVLSLVAVDSVGNESAATTLTVRRRAECVPRPDGMAAHWAGEDNAADAVGGRHGTLHGPTFASAVVGAGFRFDGVDDYVELPNLDRNTLTFAAWIKRGRTSAPGLSDSLLLSVANGGWGVAFQSPRNTLVFTKVGVNDVESLGEIDDTTAFHHVAVTYDGSRVRFYIDGALDSERSYSATFGSNGSAYTMGSRGAGGEFFAGVMDEVEVYDRALGAHEVAAIRQAGSFGRCPDACVTRPSGVVAWWPGRGNTRDIVGGHDASLLGGIAYAQGRVGNAFRFDGDDDGLQIETNTALEPQRYTVEAWVRADGPGPNEDEGGSVAITKGSADGLRATLSLGYRWTDRRFRYLFGSVETEEILSTDTFAPGVFHHVVVTYDGAAFRLYVNGLEQGNRSLSKTVAYESQPWTIGTNVPWARDVGFRRTWNGLIDEPTLYDRALSRAEIRTLYAAGAAGKCAAPEPAMITGITSGQALRGIVSIGGATTDDPGFLGRIDILSGGTVLAAAPAPSFTTTLDTTRMAEGPLILQARAVDRFGNVGPLGPAVAAVIDNVPLTVTITSPLAGSAFRTSVTVKADPSESTRRIELMLGAATVTDDTPPYEATFPLGALEERAHTITVTAHGLAGEVATTTRSIVVDRTPPAAPDPTKIVAEAPNGVPPPALTIKEDLRLWLRADAGLVVDAAGRVSAWADQSDQRQTVVQPDSSRQPLLANSALNGRPAIRFDGTNDHMFGAPPLLTSQQFTVFAVANATHSDGSHHEIISNWETNNRLDSVFLGLTAGNKVRFTDALGHTGIGAIPNPGSHFILTGVSGSSDAWIYLGDTALAHSSALPTRNLSTPFHIGRQGSLDDEFWQGDIVEVLVYDAHLSDGDRSTVWNYLREKYVTGPPAGTGTSLVFGQTGAVEPHVAVETTNVARETVVTGRASPDGSFGLSIGAVAGDLLTFVAIDAAGNRSEPTAVVVRDQAPSVDGEIDVSFYGRLTDRVGVNVLTPDGRLDGVFAASLNVGNGTTRRLIAVDITGPGARSTRAGASAILGVATDLGAPFANTRDVLDLPLTGPVTLLLIAHDDGFIQHAAAYSVSATFADGSRFVGTLPALALPIQEAMSPTFSVRNLALPPVPSTDAGEATSAVVSVKNTSLPASPANEVGEATSPVVSVRNTALPDVAGSEPKEATGPVISIRNLALPEVAAAEPKEAVGPAFTVKNLQGLPSPGTLQWSAAEQTVVEGAGSVTVTVSRAGGSEGTVAVNYVTVDGTAQAGRDYVHTQGPLLLGHGEVSRAIVVTLLNDEMPEGPEAFQVVLSSPAGGATLGTPETTTVRIADDELLPTLSIEDTTVIEGDHGTLAAPFTARLSEASAQTVVADYVTAPISAKPGADYEAVTGQVVFAPGTTVRTIPVSVRGDLRYEPDEMFGLALANPAGASVGVAQAIGTIVNDDPTPACVTAPSGAVAWWPLDGNGVEVMGGSDATLQGGVAFTGGHVRQGLTFDGVDDVAVASDAHLPMGAAARTLEFWMKAPPNARVPILYGSASPDNAFAVVVTGEVACIARWRGPGADACGTTPITDGEWHHLALTYDGLEARLYVDGAFETNASVTYATAATGSLVLGAIPGSSTVFFRGQLDEVSIYDRALDQAEIEEIVRGEYEGKCCQCAPPPDGRIGSWPGEDDAVDRAGDNDGIASPAVAFAPGQVGQAFELNGSGAYVEIPAHESLDPAGVFSVEFWAYPVTHTSSGLLTRVDNQVDGPGWVLAYYGTSGGPERAEFHVLLSHAQRGFVAGGARSVPFGQWTHVAGTSDGTTLRLFLNGVEVGASPSPVVVPSPFSVLIGAYQRNGNKEQFFHGRIDEVNLYDRALSAAQIRAIVNAGRAGMCVAD